MCLLPILTIIQIADAVVPIMDQIRWTHFRGFQYAVMNDQANNIVDAFENCLEKGGWPAFPLDKAESEFFGRLLDQRRGKGAIAYMSVTRESPYTVDEWRTAKGPINFDLVSDESIDFLSYHCMVVRIDGSWSTLPCTIPFKKINVICQRVYDRAGTWMKRKTQKLKCSCVTTVTVIASIGTFIFLMIGIILGFHALMEQIGLFDEESQDISDEPDYNMAGNGPMAVEHLGAEAEDFCVSQHLYLKPTALLKITVLLPKMRIPGQSISNWDLMERLKKAVAPVQLDSIRVRESSMDSVAFEAELLSQMIMKKTIKALNSVTMKMNETKPGERPDTVYLAKIPVKWFNDGVIDLPSENRLKRAMELFGKVRAVDIPICDPLRPMMPAKISGIKTKGFGVHQNLFFEAYVQYMEYKGFATAMDQLRNKKWAKRIDGKFFQAAVKVDFDRTSHLSETMILNRLDERRRILNEKLKKEEDEQTARVLEELKQKQEEDEKEQRREERERKRREKKELERQQEIERQRLEAENLEMERRAKQRRILESQRLLEYVFERISAKEERKKNARGGTAATGLEKDRRFGRAAG
ncbi:unnamed protein product [Caenorhabditis auriculariae]|uniref:C-type lectin domain-containing protein n=1 Tax=Caenorhabditis auriculariae TaxID=2777116 RepID=A0A8S1HU83_9PELO|nr:unnamed protein product [Caenorhabditis auriculariae]